MEELWCFLSYTSCPHEIVVGPLLLQAARVQGEGSVGQLKGPAGSGAGLGQAPQAAGPKARRAQHRPLVVPPR